MFPSSSSSMVHIKKGKKIKDKPMARNAYAIIHHLP
jgi:hypothetical protein